jgi:hypothetical protein
VIVEGASRGAPLEEVFDHVVVGSGAAGATAAVVLAEAGSSVAVVEEGPTVGTEQFRDRAYASLRTLYRDMGTQVARGRVAIPVFQGRCLGGSTVVNSAIMWRLPEDVWAGWRDDFGLGDALPLADLVQNFYRIEADLSVAPTPEDVWGGNNRLMAAAGTALGVRATPMRRAVVGCRGSARCQSGCPHGAKQSMALTCLPRAEQRGAVLFAGARADRAELAGDRAVAVAGRFAGGGRFRLHARRSVVVAASATQTPGLLRRSGVRSSQVGAHFQAHSGASVVGLFDQPVGLWAGATQGFESDQHRIDGGFKVESVALMPELLIATLPGVGARWLEAIGRAGHMAMWVVDMRAHAEGRIDPRRDRPRIPFDLERRDVANLRRGLAFSAEMMFAAGARAIMPLVHGLPEVIERPEDVRLLRDGPNDPRAYSMALRTCLGRRGSSFHGSWWVRRSPLLRTRHLRSADPGLGIAQPVALALRLDDLAPMGQAIKGRPGEALRAQHLGPVIERQVGRDHQAGPLVGGGDDVEQQLGPDLGGRDVAQLVEHQQVELPQAGPQPEEGAFVPRLDEQRDQLGDSEEPDPVTTGARGGRKADREMRLPGPGVPDEEHVLPAVDELPPGHEHLVHRGTGGEVEGLQGLERGEPGGLEPAFCGSALALQQLQLGDLQQVGEVIDVVGRGPPRHLLALGPDGGEPERLQVMVQQHHGLRLKGLHADAPFREA